MSRLSPAMEVKAQWYCLRSQPKHEAIAAAHLRRLASLEVCCPRVRFQRPRRAAGGGAAGWSWATEAMFPGYLFARFDLEARCREIQYSHGVSGIVRFGERYLPIPSAAIRELRSAVEPDEVTTVIPAPAAGQEVMVTGGALLGLKAVVTHYLPAKQRVLVLLEFMGRAVHAEVAESSVVVPFVHPLRTGRSG